MELQQKPITPIVTYIQIAGHNNPETGNTLAQGKGSVKFIINKFEKNRVPGTPGVVAATEKQDEMGTIIQNAVPQVAAVPEHDEYVDRGIWNNPTVTLDELAEAGVVNISKLHEFTNSLIQKMAQSSQPM